VAAVGGLLVGAAVGGLALPRTTTDTVRSESSTLRTVVRTVTAPTATTPAPPRPTRPTTSRADAESAARSAANTYTTDRYSIGGKAGDWSANCQTSGEDWACQVTFNQTECTGSVVVGGETLRTLRARIGCSE
jgi:invasion protein IalB